jgi:hypothetical protein
MIEYLAISATPNLGWRSHTLETNDAPHDFVDLFYVHIRVILTDRIFLLDKCQPGSDDQEDQRPESQVPAKRDETVSERCGSEVFVPAHQPVREAPQCAYENSTLLKDRKTVKARALPMPKPIVWAVEAYDRFWGERRVRAQPKCQLSSQCLCEVTHHRQRYLYVSACKTAQNDRETYPE